MNEQLTSEQVTAEREFVRQAKEYVSLRAELVDRGAKLAELLKGRTGVTIVQMENPVRCYELSRTYSPSTNELPVHVRPATVLWD